MSVRTPIQVPEELKSNIDDLKGKFHAKTHYEVIEKLVNYYNSNEKQKEADRKQRELDKQKQKQTMVYLGEKTKEQYVQLGEFLGLKSEASIAEFLLAHYHESPSISKEMIGLLVSLQQGKG